MDVKIVIGTVEMRGRRWPVILRELGSEMGPVLQVGDMDRDEELFDDFGQFLSAWGQTFVAGKMERTDELERLFAEVKDAKANFDKAEEAFYAELVRVYGAWAADAIEVGDCGEATMDDVRQILADWKRLNPAIGQ